MSYRAIRFDNLLSQYTSKGKKLGFDEMRKI